VNNPYQQYKQTAVATASPEKLILMLYEGGLRFLKQADEAIEHNNLVEAGKAIGKTQEVVGELISSLNPEAGEVSKNLQSLYTYINGRLIEANLKKDRQIVKEILGMFQEFHATWSEIMKTGRSGQQTGGVNIEG